MKVLVVGSGGREHALAWKIAQSPLLTRLVVAPGNPGMAGLAQRVDLKVTDTDGLVRLAKDMDADLVVVGPEAALEVGLADALAEVGIACFGPTKAAAQLETSKGFTKAFAMRHKVPTADYGEFSDAADAKAALNRFSPPYVIKADGIAAGKGVVIATDRTQAEAAIDDMLGGRFGQAGARLVIEAFMDGEEASVFALSDGETSLMFGAAQDHKRVGDGDTGPNTGGMGAYAPAPVMTSERLEIVRTAMIEATVAGMATEGAPYRGILFAGVMSTAEGPKLVEYNARFGDPECQVLMLRLKSDLLPYLHACATGNLAAQGPLLWRDEAVICVVMAAQGYPDAPLTGSIIVGADGDFGPDVFVFHAGTTLDADGNLRANGGRVLNICARATTVAGARQLAYQAIDRIVWPQGFCRSDIAWRAMDRPA